MTARAFARGHPIHFDGCWRYEDGVPITEERPCIRCGRMPIDGMDACLGKLEGVKVPAVATELKMGIRFSFHDNPLGLRIGEVVKVRRTCRVEYEGAFQENGAEKKLWFDDFNGALIVAGSVKRALGKYVAGSSGHGEWDDFVPAYLKVSKYVWLYECKKTMSGKPFLVHPDDITRCNREKA